MNKDIQKRENKKNEERDDYYSGNRGEKYPQVKPGISKTTQPSAQYKPNANYYHSAIDEQEKK